MNPVKIKNQKNQKSKNSKNYASENKKNDIKNNYIKNVIFSLILQCKVENRLPSRFRRTVKSRDLSLDFLVALM